jgi:cyanophycinase
VDRSSKESIAMGVVLPSWRIRARIRGRLTGHAATLLALVSLASVMTARCEMRPSSAARRAVRRTAGEGYLYCVLGDPADVVTATRPGLVLEGGGTDIDESFRWMIERSGGGDFVVLRTSGTDAYNVYIDDLPAPGGLSPDSVATLIVRSRAASFDPFVIGTIRGAEALWIAGGDQSRHVSIWRGTPVADAINELAARGVPIGGTSAGLAVMGQFVYSAEADGAAAPHLSSAQALRDPFHPRVTLRRDFLRLPDLRGTILEPHFEQEGRYGRMAAFLARLATEGSAREVRGIGIDRETALLVEADGTARVITGPDHPFGSATLFRLSARPEICEPGHPLTASGIELIRFGSGDRVDLRRWGGEGGTAFRLSIEEGIPRVERTSMKPVSTGSRTPSSSPQRAGDVGSQFEAGY